MVAAQERTSQGSHPGPRIAAPLGDSEAVFGTESVVSLQNLSVHYGSFLAVTDVNFEVPKNRITALIGPSGCGKSTVLRCINRMNDLVGTARVREALPARGRAGLPRRGGGEG